MYRNDATRRFLSSSDSRSCVVKEELYGMYMSEATRRFLSSPLVTQVSSAELQIDSSRRHIRRSELVVSTPLG